MSLQSSQTNLGEDICRGCAKTGDQMINVFNNDIHLTSTSFQDFFMFLSSMQIHKNDGLSSRICLLCIESLVDSHNFRCQTQRTEGMLRIQEHLEMHGRIEYNPSSWQLQTRGDFLHHVEIYHGFSYPYECHECDETFLTRISLQAHILLHDHKENIHSMFECSKCNLKFSSESEKYRHQKSHDLIYPCRYCTKRYAYEHVVKAHKSNHKGVGFTQNEWDSSSYDDEATPAKQGRLTHSEMPAMEETRETIPHPRATAFNCLHAGCYEKFPRLSELKKHMATHDKSDNKRSKDVHHGSQYPNEASLISDQLKDLTDQCRIQPNALYFHHSTCCSPGLSQESGQRIEYLNNLGLKPKMPRIKPRTANSNKPLFLNGMMLKKLIIKKNKTNRRALLESDSSSDGSESDAGRKNHIKPDMKSETKPPCGEEKNAKNKKNLNSNVNENLQQNSNNKSNEKPLEKSQNEVTISDPNSDESLPLPGIPPGVIFPKFKKIPLNKFLAGNKHRYCCNNIHCRWDIFKQQKTLECS